jgi:hypothetical protein
MQLVSVTNGLGGWGNMINLSMTSLERELIDALIVMTLALGL